jgi:hypothetical protein
MSKIAALIIESPALEPGDFYAALELLHPLAGAQWDIDIKEEIPIGKVAVNVYTPPWGKDGAVLGGLFVFGAPFVYALHLDSRPDHEGEVRWFKNPSVVIS